MADETPTTVVAPETVASQAVVAPDTVTTVATAPVTPTPADFKQAVAESPIQSSPPNSVIEAMVREGEYMGNVTGEAAAEATLKTFASRVKTAFGTGAARSA